MTIAALRSARKAGLAGFARAVLVGSAILLGGASAASAQAAPDTVVATVNGQPITELDLSNMALLLGDALIDLTPAEARQRVIDEVISSRLMTAAGETLGLDQTPAFIAQLELLRERLVQNEYVRAVVLSQLTDAALRARYDEYVVQGVVPRQMGVRHIEVATEAEAVEIIGLLNAGGNFEEIATARTLDLFGRDRGGQLCYQDDETTDIVCTWTEGQLVQVFEDALLALQPGQYTQVPVQLDRGDRISWHVLKLDSLQFQPFEDLRDQIGQYMYAEMVDAELTRLRAAADIVILPAADATTPTTPALPTIPGFGIPPATTPETVPTPTPEAPATPTPNPEAPATPTPTPTPTP